MTTGATTLPDAIRFAILAQLNNIHTAMPGQIISYDFTTQMATIQPCINKRWVTGAINQMPVLQNVPVIFPNSGGASLTFPVNAGDTCLLVFCERSIDDWKSNGVNANGVVTPSDPRKLDLSDGVAFVGLKPFNSAFPPRTNNTDLLLNYAGSSVTIQPNGTILIGSPGGVLITIAQNGAVSFSSASGSSISIAANGAIKLNTASTLALGMPGNELIAQLLVILNSLNNVITALSVDTNVQSATRNAALTSLGVTVPVIAQLTTLDGTLP